MIQEHLALAPLDITISNSPEISSKQVTSDTYDPTQIICTNNSSDYSHITDFQVSSRGSTIETDTATGLINSVTTGTTVLSQDKEVVAQTSNINVDSDSFQLKLVPDSIQITSTKTFNSKDSDIFTTNPNNCLAVHSLIQTQGTNNSGHTSNISTQPKTTYQGRPYLPNTTKSAGDTSYILVVDNISSSWKFKNSSTIKSEFSKFFPDISLKLAHSLRAGGIVLHFKSLTDLEKVRDFNWPKSAFGSSGDSIVIKHITNNPRIIFKNVNPSISEQDIQDRLFNFTGEHTKVHRFKNRDSNKPIPVVKVSCSIKAAQRLLDNKLAINGDDIITEKFVPNHSPNIICFKCRKPGHSARFCN